MDSFSFVPVYKRLTDLYRSRIINQEYLPDQRIDSITRISERHSVSRETAKLVLKNLIKEGLIISKAGKGSFVTPQAKTHSTWGLIIPFFSSNMEELIVSLNNEASLRKRKFEYYLAYNNPDEEMKLVGRMIREGYEAVIVVPNFNELLTTGYYLRLLQGNTKVVMVDNTMAGSHFRYVVQSYDLGVKRALDYLGSKNNGNLMLVKNEIWKGKNLLQELIEQTFLTIAADIFPGRKAFVSSQLNDIGKYYLESRKIGGILTCVDTDAVRLIGRIKMWEAMEVSLVSYGNTELTSLFQPAITVIDCHYQMMAEKTAGFLDEKEPGGGVYQYVIQPSLVIRDT